MGGPTNTYPRVSLEDVEQAMRDVEKAHCCDITVKLSHPANEGTPVLFWVRVEAVPRIVAKKTIRQPLAVSHRGPSVDFKHIEALMLRLVLKLDRELDQFGHVPAEQASFLWDTAK